MADVNGRSGPFNPAIGLGTRQSNVVIGIAPGSLAATVSSQSWEQAALGNFIGVQAEASGNYSQAQGDVPRDFDPAFLANVVNGSSTAASWGYNRASSNQYKFGVAVPAPDTFTVTITTNNQQAGGTPDVATANVKDQLGANLSGATVKWSVVGGTATGGAVAAPTSVTNGSGNATVNVTATGAGTVIVQAQVDGTAVTPKTATATFTAP